MCWPAMCCPLCHAVTMAGGCCIQPCRVLPACPVLQRSSHRLAWLEAAGTVAAARPPPKASRHRRAPGLPSSGLEMPSPFPHLPSMALTIRRATLRSSSGCRSSRYGMALLRENGAAGRDAAGRGGGMDTKVSAGQVPVPTMRACAARACTTPAALRCPAATIQRSLTCAHAPSAAMQSMCACTFCYHPVHVPSNILLPSTQPMCVQGAGAISSDAYFGREQRASSMSSQGGGNLDMSAGDLVSKISLTAKQDVDAIKQVSERKLQRRQKQQERTLLGVLNLGGVGREPLNIYVSCLNVSICDCARLSPCLRVVLPADGRTGRCEAVAHGSELHAGHSGRLLGLPCAATRQHTCCAPQRILSSSCLLAFPLKLVLSAARGTLRCAPCTLTRACCVSLCSHLLAPHCAWLAVPLACLAAVA